MSAPAAILNWWNPKKKESVLCFHQLRKQTFSIAAWFWAIVSLCLFHTLAISSYNMNSATQKNLASTFKTNRKSIDIQAFSMNKRHTPPQSVHQYPFGCEIFLSPSLSLSFLPLSLYLRQCDTLPYNYFIIQLRKYLNNNTFSIEHWNQHLKCFHFRQYSIEDDFRFDQMIWKCACSEVVYYACAGYAVTHLWLYADRCSSIGTQREWASVREGGRKCSEWINAEIAGEKRKWQSRDGNILDAARVNAHDS